jgi:hypothetical protein
MAEPLDELYLRWLYSQVGNDRLRDRRKTHWSLMRLLYTKEFVWLIPNDDNRLEDGRDLRMEFVDELGLEDLDPNWMTIGCSMLEMLIGLSRRLYFEEESNTIDEWFWELIDNLGMRDVDIDFDRHGTHSERLDRVIWRTYRQDGSGGLFPLRYPEVDQREVELWYQLCAYLLETE